jgi:hypothetical protein
VNRLIQAARQVHGEALLNDPALSGADWADAFERLIPGRVLDARTAADEAINRPARWITRLLELRNRIVGPLGLKAPSPLGGATSIGLFPVIAETPARIVLGLDDRHLDFRLVVTVEHIAGGTKVKAATLIKRHNMFGRVYLAAVMPFHKLIVPSMLNAIGAER